MSGAALALLFSGFTQHRSPAVQVVEFSDFTCGYCRKFVLQVEPALRSEFVATGRVRWTFIATSRAMLTSVAADNRRAAQMKVRIRPTFFVNGTRVEGALPLAEFRAVMLSALEQQR